MKQKLHLLFFLLALSPFTGWGQTTVTLTSGSSWTVPANVYSLKVECWGGGGAGGGVNAGSRGAAGGGAGGAYARINALTVSPGAVISYSIGAGGTASATTGQSGPGGDTWFSSNSTVLAKGGPGALTISSASAVTSGTGAVAATGSIGDVTYKGGNGGNGAAVASGTSNSGGGGSSAGTGTDGNNGATPTGGAAPTGGFAGAAGKNAGSTSTGNGNAANATDYGAGGGGASASASTGLRAGGSGAQGRIVITYTVVTCTTPTQSFTTDPVGKNVGDAAFTNTFTTNSTGAVTYSSNATNVATVDASSGLVTIVGSGTAIITASQVADATYCTASKTYTLNVSACGAPTAPTTFSATATAPTTATVSWTAGNGAGRAAFLNAGSFTTAVPAASTVYTGNASFGSGTAFDGGFAVSVGTGNSVNVTGLTANTVYSAKVFEYNNTQGNACYNTTTPLTGTLTTLSNAPVVANASNITDVAFDANWIAPATQGNATFTYTVEYSRSSVFASGNTSITGISSNTLTQTISGLTPATDYYYHVRADNAGGYSAWSATKQTTTKPSAPPAPGTPTSACGSLTYPAYGGAAAGTYYWQTSASGNDQTYPGTGTYTVTTSGTYYVRALSGTSNWSAATSVTAAVPNNPVVTTDPAAQTVAAGSTATFSVTATNAGGYQWQENTGSGWANITNGGRYSGATSASLVISNTTVGMSGYQYRVIVTAAAPCSVNTTSGAATLTVTRTTLATDYFRSIANGDYAATATWEASADSLNWYPATATPTSSAAAVTITSGTTVSVTTTSQAGKNIHVFGTLTLSQVFTITDGAETYDLVVESNGTLSLPETTNYAPTFGGSSKALYRANSLTSVVSSSAFGGIFNSNGNGAQQFFETNAVAELKITGSATLSSSGVTYFPSAAATVYPIMRIATGTALFTSSGTNYTYINGVLEINSGATFSSTNSANRYIRNGINNKGTLNGGTANIIITGTNAVLVGTGTTTISSGKNLEIATGAIATLTSNYTITGGIVLVSGTLNTNGYILNGTAAFTTASGSALNVTDANGISSSAASGNIQTTGTRSYSKTVTYTYQGSAAQITGDGLPDSVGTLILSNAAGLTLSKATTVTSALLLGTGNITTTTTNLLTLGSSVTLSGASSSSYIDGPLRRYTAASAAFAFPVGKNNVYAPAAVTPVDATPSNYTAEYFNGTQTTPSRTDKDTPTLRYVSANAYYDISRGAGANASVTLSYNESNKVTDVSTLVIAHYTGGRWVSEGGGANGGSTITSGTVTSNVVSTFSPFAIGSGSLNQPLPIRLLSFHIRKQEAVARLDWQLGTTDGGEVIVVERSADGQMFTEVNRQEVEHNALLSQSFTDYEPLTGPNYYRLRVIGINSEETFSQTLLISFGEKTAEGIKVYPNPARDVLTLEWTNSEAPSQISLHNSAGQLVWTEHMTSGNVLSIPVEKLTPGIYWITLEQERNVERQRIVVEN